MPNVKLVSIETHHSGKAGVLSVLEDLPFKIKRAFYVYDVPPGEIRGGHGHKKCHQFLVVMNGAVLVKVAKDGDFVLDNPCTGLYVPPNNVIRVQYLTDDTRLLVLASERYDTGDYIYSEVE